MSLCTVVVICVCFFQQKTAYELRISDWSSDVFSSDLRHQIVAGRIHQTVRIFHMEVAEPGVIDLTVEAGWRVVRRAEAGGTFYRDEAVAVHRDGGEAVVMNDLAVLAVVEIRQCKHTHIPGAVDHRTGALQLVGDQIGERSEEHTSELQSLMRISYAVFCLKK